MEKIKSLTFEQLVLMAIMVFLTSITATEKSRFSVKVLANFTQIIILIWLILKNKWENSTLEGLKNKK